MGKILTNNNISDTNTVDYIDYKWSIDELIKFIANIKHGEYVCKKQDHKVIQVKITESKKPR